MVDRTVVLPVNHLVKDSLLMVLQIKALPDNLLFRDNHSMVHQIVVLPVNQRIIIQEETQCHLKRVSKHHNMVEIRAMVIQILI